MILNGEKPQAFPLRRRTRQDGPLTILFNIILEGQGNAVRQEKEMKGYTK